MGRKIVGEIVQPVHDPATGEVVHEPGTRFDEGDKALKGLPPGHVRYVIVEEADKPSAKPAEEPAKAAKPSVK